MSTSNGAHSEMIVISADSHMAEPPDLWEKNLPPSSVTLRLSSPMSDSMSPISISVPVAGILRSVWWTWPMTESVPRFSSHTRLLCVARPGRGVAGSLHPRLQRLDD